MTILVYDKTFEGFLTAIFECYENKLTPAKFVSEGEFQSILFGEEHHVATNSSKAERVWKGLHTKLSPIACKMLAVNYLSELADIELLLYQFIRKAFESTASIENNFGDTCVLQIHQLFRKVTRETERIRMFVRFQKTHDNIWFASFDPQYNVLPLAVSHFKERFADQPWIIYDTNRKYGFHYDLTSLSEIRFDESKIHLVTGVLDQSAITDDERLFQKLWKTYFKEMEIKERHNPSLHKRLLPKRFWKYLTEKQ